METTLKRKIIRKETTYTENIQEQHKEMRREESHEKTNK